jgi:hypothetical protein
MARDLPTPCQLLRARDWLWAGAPAAARDYDAKEAVKTLCVLIDAMPALLPIYCYGTPENRKALLECEAAEDAAARAEPVKAAVSELTRELWGDPEVQPDPREEWSQERLQALVKALARVTGVPIPPWA